MKLIQQKKSVILLPNAYRNQGEVCIFMSKVQKNILKIKNMGVSIEV